MQDSFTLVVSLGFILSGFLIFGRGRRKPTVQEDSSKEFIPARWSPKTLRFAGVGMVLVGILMLAGEHFHLF